MMLPILTLAACLAQPAADWTPLFDGKTLAGFTQHGGHAVYAAEDNCIVGRTKRGEPNSFLCTDRDYADFILEFDVKVDRALNSGCQIRSHARTDNDTVYGYQVEIEATPRGFSAGIYEEGGRGWLAQPTPDQAKSTPVNPDDWNHYRIEARGSRIRTSINGIPVADLIDDKTPTGFIAFQVHGVGDRADTLEVRWRNIRIQELD